MNEDRHRSDGPALSIVVPVYNEEANVVACYGEIVEAMGGAGLDYEVVFVDDGSTDRTLSLLRDAIAGDERARAVELRRNFGQSAALAAGFDEARGEVIVPMDGDLQNDPRDIPALLAKMGEGPGCDVVSGWRARRRDNLLRRLPSRLANMIISSVTGVRLHDYGCTLKAYRRDVLADIRLYGEMHRFIPALAAWVGGRVTEMPVNHRPRVAGSSKYGIGRTFRVVLDLTTVKFMMSYLTKPLYYFGRWSVVLLLGSLAVLAVVVIEKLNRGTDMTGNPFLYMSVALWIVSIQVMLMGLMMEIITRTYHESQGRKPYAVRAVHMGRGERGGREGARGSEAGRAAHEAPRGEPE